MSIPSSYYIISKIGPC